VRAFFEWLAREPGYRSKIVALLLAAGIYGAWVIAVWVLKHR
jgi:hypothetical protein